MADGNTQELKLHIVSDADTKGFTQMSAAGNKLKSETSDLSDETRRQSGAVNELEQASIKSAEATEADGLSKRELRKVLLDIGNVAAPSAGRALMELPLGPVGAGLALVAVYEMVKKTLDDDADAMQKVADAAAEPDTAGIKGLADAWDSAEKSLGDYYAKMRSAGEDEDPIATHIKRIKEVADAQVEASKKIVEALGKEEVANIRVRNAQTGVGAEQTAQKVAAAEARTQAQLASLDEDKQDAAGRAALVEEQNERLAANARLQDEAIAKTKAFGEAKLQHDNDESKLQTAKDALDPNTKSGADLKQRTDAAAKKLEDAQALPTTIASGANDGQMVDVSASRNEAIAAAQNDLDKVQAEHLRYQKEKDQLEANKHTRDNNFQAAQTAASAAQATSDTNQTRLNKLPGEIDQAGTVQGITANGNNTVNAIKSGQQAIINDTNAGNGGDAREAVRQFQQSKDVLQTVTSTLREVGTQNVEAHNALLKVVRDLFASMSRLQAQINSMTQVGR